MIDIAIGGLTPFTTIDYPEKLSCVVFCQGCCLRCVYCHNRHLQPRDAAPVHSWTEIEAFLEKRKGRLEAIVFSGGEPLLQAGLGEAMQSAKDLGYAIGLHTTGLPVERLKAVLPLTDWIGFDVKTLFERYEDVTQAPGSGEKARQALEAILESGTDFEARTTVDPTCHNPSLLNELSHRLEAMGVKTYALQRRRWSEDEPKPIGIDENALDLMFEETFLAHMRLRFDNFIVRTSCSKFYGLERVHNICRHRNSDSVIC